MLPDFARRLDPEAEPEWMDGPCAYSDFKECVQDIAKATRLTLAYRPTLRFVAEACAHHTEPRPMHIVDVGSGGGDMLRRIGDWARKHRAPVRLTGIDLNPHGTRAARELSGQYDGRSGHPAIEWITGDLFTCPAVQAPDVVISSLVTHHMRDGEVVAFLRWMEAHARLGWFCSDLLRSPRSYRLFGWLAVAMKWHRFVRHDGPVSIRRAFREEDWVRLVGEAGIAPELVGIRRCAIGRLCLRRLGVEHTNKAREVRPC